MSNYWQVRQAKQRVKYADATHKQIRKYSKKLYKQALREVNNLMTEYYYKILDAEGKPSANEMYKYNRYFEMRKELESILTSLGSKYIKGINPKMENVYKWTSKSVLNTYVAGIDTETTTVVAHELWKAKGKYWSEKVWCNDGINASTRISNNMSKLQSTLEAGLTNCVARGATKDELVKELQKRFNVSYNEADRLARTELSYVQNQATLDTYQKADIKEYEYLAIIDDRTSDTCKDLNGQKFDINTAMVGVNYPPMHPNCRCTTIASI